LSRDLQLNCVISFFFFRLHLILHVCAARFDVTGTVALFGFHFGTKHALSSTGVQLYILHAAKTLCATLYYTGFRFLQD
jgi:hypothetical protein